MSTTQTVYVLRHLGQAWLRQLIFDQYPVDLYNLLYPHCYMVSSVAALATMLWQSGCTTSNSTFLENSPKCV